MAKKKLCLSDVAKKDVKIILYLIVSWVLGISISMIADNPNLMGMIPVINYIMYRTEKELKNEGYMETLK